MRRLVHALLVAAALVVKLVLELLSLHLSLGARAVVVVAVRTVLRGHVR